MLIETTRREMSMQHLHRQTQAQFTPSDLLGIHALLDCVLQSSVQALLRAREPGAEELDIGSDGLSN